MVERNKQGWWIIPLGMVAALRNQNEADDQTGPDWLARLFCARRHPPCVAVAAAARATGDELAPVAGRSRLARSLPGRTRPSLSGSCVAHALVT